MPAICSHNDVLLSASDYIAPSGSMVASAVALADAVNDCLRSVDALTVDLHKVRAAASSYFNALLLRIAQVHGADAIEHRISFHFASDAQQAMFDRSLRAVLDSL